MVRGHDAYAAVAEVANHAVGAAELVDGVTGAQHLVDAATRALRRDIQGGRVAVDVRDQTDAQRTRYLFREDRGHNLFDRALHLGVVGETPDDCGLAGAQR